MSLIIHRIIKFQNQTDEYPLTQGKEYTVCAVGDNENIPWYCIYDDNTDYYPMWRPSFLFEVSDNRLSRYWVFSIEEMEGNKKTLLSFPEWSNDHYYYGKLVEGESNDPIAHVFKNYRDLMELEFSDKNVKEIAKIGNESWLICPQCIDAWECMNFMDGMVKCPKCKKMMHNPRYVEH